MRVDGCVRTGRKWFWLTTRSQSSPVESERSTVSAAALDSGSDQPDKEGLIERG